MMLAYSEILKRITGVEERNLEKYFRLLSESQLSPLRYSVLKQLAKQDKATIGSLLQSLDQHRTGGTYVTIQSFFTELAGKGLLEKVPVGRRNYWKFKEELSQLKQYLNVM